MEIKKSFLKKLSKFKNLDIFGKQLMFEEDNSQRFSTNIGFLFTMLIFISLIVIAFFLGKDIYQRRYPKLVTSKRIITNSLEQLEHSSILNIKEFPIMFYITNNHGDIEKSDLNELFTFITTSVQINEDSSKQIDYYYGASLCNSSNYYNEYKDFIDNELQRNPYLYCFDKDLNFNLTYDKVSTFDNRMKDHYKYSSIYHSINKCNDNIKSIEYLKKFDKDNNTTTVLHEYKHNNSCTNKPYSIYNQNNFLVTFLNINTFFDYRNYSYPLINESQSTKYMLNSKTTRKIEYSVEIEKLKSDKGWLMEKLITIVRRGVNIISNNNYLSESEELLLVEINLSSKYQSTFRYYLKIQDLLAKIGGLFSAFQIIIQIILSDYINFKYRINYFNDSIDNKKLQDINFHVYNKEVKTINTKDNVNMINNSNNNKNNVSNNKNANVPEQNNKLKDNIILVHFDNSQSSNVDNANNKINNFNLQPNNENKLSTFKVAPNREINRFLSNKSNKSNSKSIKNTNTNFNTRSINNTGNSNYLKEMSHNKLLTTKNEEDKILDKIKSSNLKLNNYVEKRNSNNMFTEEEEVARTLKIRELKSSFKNHNKIISNIINKNSSKNLENYDDPDIELREYIKDQKKFIFDVNNNGSDENDFDKINLRREKRKTNYSGKIISVINHDNAISNVALNKQMSSLNNINNMNSLNNINNVNNVNNVNNMNINNNIFPSTSSGSSSSPVNISNLKIILESKDFSKLMKKELDYLLQKLSYFQYCYYRFINSVCCFKAFKIYPVKKLLTKLVNSKITREIYSIKNYLHTMQRLKNSTNISTKK